MMDHASLVGKLRDIHAPPTDDICALMIMTFLGGILGVGFACMMIIFKTGKLGVSNKVLQKLNSSRNLSSSDRLAIQARLLRDVAIAFDSGSAFLRGEEWLCKLDYIFRTNYFTGDSGRIFGDELYKPAHSPDVDKIDADLSFLIKRLDDVRD